MNKHQLLLAAACLMGPGPASAEPTRELRVAGTDEVFAGDPESVSLTARGFVEPGPDVRPLGDVKGAVTRVLGTADGFVVGTTENGVYRVTRSGKTSEPAVPDPAGTVTALLEAPDGIWVAVAPGGQIYRYADGRLQPVAKLDVGYVWDLALQGGQVLAATGNPGRILQVRPGRDPKILHESTEKHLRAVATRGDRIVFVGGDEGVVYQMQGGKVRALYDSELSEGTAVRIEPEGVLAAFVDAKRSAELEPFRFIGEIGEEDDEGPFEGSEVIRIDDEGRVSVLWTSQREGALDLMRVGDEIWVGTAGSNENRGRAYGLDLTRDELRVSTRFEAPLVTDLAVSGDVQVAGLAPGGGLVRIGPGLVEVAVYRSSEQDFNRVGRVGRLWFDAELPRGTKVELRLRTGNTSKASVAWSEWSRPVTTPDGGPVDVPQGRYAQFEARLYARGDSVPRLRSMHASVVRLNDAPRVLEVFTLRRDVMMEPLPPDGDRDKTVTLSRGSLNELRRPEEDDEDRTRVRQSTREGYMTVAWHAADTNGDALRYSVAMERLDDGSVTRLGEQLEHPFHSFDSRAFPDGRYVFRVTASDRPSNRPEASLEGRADSQPILIDNGAPELSDLNVSMQGERLIVTARAQDAQSPLAAAEVAVDGGAFVLMPAVDGLVDSRSERLRVELPRPTRTAVIAVRVTDDAGNRTTRSTTYAPR